MNLAKGITSVQSIIASNTLEMLFYLTFRTFPRSIQFMEKEAEIRGD